MPPKQQAQESGLEVQLPTNPEVVPQLYESNYYVGDREINYAVFDQRNQNKRQAPEKGRGRRRAFWISAVVLILCLIAALGAGLGAGLVTQHKPSSPGSPSADTHTGSASANIAPITILEGSNPPVTITQFGKVTTITPSPTQPSSPICPAGDRSTCIATNRPLPTIDPYLDWHIPNQTLSFKILCYTKFAAGDGITRDLQIYTNVSSLSDCLDRCALFNFNARSMNFPALGCTGITLGTGDVLRQTGGDSGGPWHTCWLQSNVSLESANDTAHTPGFDGAVLLGL